MAYSYLLKSSMPFSQECDDIHIYFEIKYAPFTGM